MCRCLRTIAYVHAVLRAAPADAVDDQIVTRNVAQLVSPPRSTTKELQTLEDDELTRLLTAISSDRLRVLWLVLLGLSLRRGEALALRWDDLDLDGRTVRISRSLQRVRGPVDPATGHRSGRLVELPPKTAASAASLALPDTLVTALRQHRQDQLRERLQARVWTDDGLVFTSSVGTYLEPRNIDRTWKALLLRAGVRPLRIHDLRQRDGDRPHHGRSRHEGHPAD